MGLSFWHLIIILFIVLLLFGPNRLPSLAKSLAESIKGFKQGLKDDEIDVTTTARKEQIRDAETGSGSNTSQSQTQKETKKDNV